MNWDNGITSDRYTIHRAMLATAVGTFVICYRVDMMRVAHNSFNMLIYLWQLRSCVKLITCQLTLPKVTLHYTNWPPYTCTYFMVQMYSYIVYIYTRTCMYMW